MLFFAGCGCEGMLRVVWFFTASLFQDIARLKCCIAEFVCVWHFILTYTEREIKGAEKHIKLLVA